MKEYLVQSGPLKIAVFAESSREAAIEALTWWNELPRSQDRDYTSLHATNHRANLAESVVVQPAAARIPMRKFPTFNLLARVRGENPKDAWRKVLANLVGRDN